MHVRDRLTMDSGDTEDRISQLPDPILHHILSKVFKFRNITDLVRTCILISKRWSNLWASFPYLQLDACCLVPDIDSNIRLTLRFARMVNAVLLLRDTSDVHSLILRRTDDYDEHDHHRLVTWMQYVVNRNVKVLVISVVLDYKHFKLPSGVFTCRFMERLELVIKCQGFLGVRYLELPKFVQLDRLRKLSLTHFNCYPISLHILLFGCPVLEDMELSNCMLQDPDICSNSLTELEFSFCTIMGTRLRISVPSLQYLSLTNNDIGMSEVLLDNLSSLDTAFLQTDDYAGHHRNKGLEPLNYISPCKKYVSGKELSELQSFHNLKNIYLDGSININNLPIIAHFLQRSPKLEHITLGCKDVISLDPILKKKKLKMDFDCPHLKDILATFDEKNGGISELLNDFCANKCSCFEE